MASSLMNMTRDINGYVTYGRDPATNAESTTLVANAVQTFTVPSNYEYWQAIFSYSPGAQVFVSTVGAAVVPSSSVASTSSVLNPTSYRLKAGTSISAITPDTSDYMTVEYYAIQ